MTNEKSLDFGPESKNSVKYVLNLKMVNIWSKSHDVYNNEPFLQNI
jgi:hypothetical protein